MEPDWAVITIVHVMPNNDMMEHSLVRDCWCGAVVGEGSTIDGSPCLQIVHHALDGRPN